MNKNTSVSVDREAWLNKAVDELRPIFEEYGYAIPPVRVSVGFPSRGAVSRRKLAVGQCWDKVTSADGVAQIFISPLLDLVVDPAQKEGAAGVLDTLVHECVHAVVGSKAGHGAVFGKCARAVGLQGKLTSGFAGQALVGRLDTVAKKLGPYPHAKLTPSLKESKKQGTRMIKCECGDCGYTVRTTKKWLEDVGAPWCPKHRKAMEFELPDEDESEDEE